MCKYQHACKKTLGFLGKIGLFIGILVVFYKLPTLLADKWFSYGVKCRNYSQGLED